MRKYALINNLVVTGIVEVEETEYSDFSKKNNMVVDITDLNPQPQINWVLNGNQLEFPVGISDREKFEIELNDKKCKFGDKISKDAINRIGARNKILNKSGSQVITLLTQLISIKALLETGALGTARSSCMQLKFVYTEYQDIFDYVISEITIFETNNGL